MRNDWYCPTNDYMGDFLAIKHRETKELELNSVLGMIWEYSATHYKICIYRSTISNKHCPNPDYKYKKGDEVLILIPKSDLNKWVRILKIRKNRKGMVKRANLS